MLLLLIANISYSTATNIAARHPASQVRSAEINIVQGANIYGNGKMQSVLRVRYEFAPEVKLIKIELKEFGSGESLGKIGWKESDRDNGYDHNIGVTRLKNTLQNITDENYKNIYVSTDKKNSWLQVCFDLTTQKENVTATYSTCQDEGIINGTAHLFSERPQTYYARDFIFKETAYLLNILPNDVDGMLYTLTLGNKIPRDIYFSVINFSYPDTDFLDDSTKSLLRYYFHHLAADKDVSYIDTWLLKPDQDTKFEVFSAIEERVVTVIPSTFYPNAVMHIFNVKYRQKAYLSRNWRCKKSTFIEGKEQCIVPKQGGGQEIKQVDSKILTPYMKNVRNYKLTLEDNYGTQHPMTIFYGVGEHNKTLYLE